MGDIYVTTIQVAVEAESNLEAASKVQEGIEKFAKDWQYLSLDGQILYPTIKITDKSQPKVF